MLTSRKLTPARSCRTPTSDQWRTRMSSVTAVIEQIEDSGGFEKLREEWTDLLHGSASNCLFLTWEWLYTWWKHLSAGRRLFIITVRCGQELIAIAPLTLRPPRLTPLWPCRSFACVGLELACS